MIINKYLEKASGVNNSFYNISLKKFLTENLKKSLADFSQSILHSHMSNSVKSSEESYTKMKLSSCEHFSIFDPFLKNKYRCDKVKDNLKLAKIKRGAFSLSKCKTKDDAIIFSRSMLEQMLTGENPELPENLDLKDKVLNDVPLFGIFLDNSNNKNLRKIISGLFSLIFSVESIVLSSNVNKLIYGVINDTLNTINDGLSKTSVRGKIKLANDLVDFLKKTNHFYDYKTGTVEHSSMEIIIAIVSKDDYLMDKLIKIQCNSLKNTTQFIKNLISLDDARNKFEELTNLKIQFISEKLENITKGLSRNNKANVALNTPSLLLQVKRLNSEKSKFKGYIESLNILSSPILKTLDKKENMTLEEIKNIIVKNKFYISSINYGIKNENMLFSQVLINLKTVEETDCWFINLIRENNNDLELCYYIANTIKSDLVQNYFLFMLYCKSNGFKENIVSNKIVLLNSLSKFLFESEDIEKHKDYICKELLERIHSLFHLKEFVRRYNLSEINTKHLNMSLQYIFNKQNGIRSTTSKYYNSPLYSDEFEIERNGIIKEPIKKIVNLFDDWKFYSFIIYLTSASKVIDVKVISYLINRLGDRFKINDLKILDKFKVKELLEDENIDSEVQRMLIYSKFYKDEKSIDINNI